MDTTRRGFLGAAAAMVAAPTVPLAAPEKPGRRVWRAEIEPMVLKRGEHWHSAEQAYLLPHSDVGWSEEWEMESDGIPADISVGVYGPGDGAWVEVSLSNPYSDLAEVPRFAIIVREEKE